MPKPLSVVLAQIEKRLSRIEAQLDELLAGSLEDQLLRGRDALHEPARRERLRRAKARVDK